MRKLLIVVFLVVAVVVIAGQYFTFKAGSDKDGKYRVLIVNKKSGMITQLWGK